MSFEAESLYQLLPENYSTRDHDGALTALVRVLSEQAQVLQDDLECLYDNHFIETCDEWAVPYLGALVGARNLPDEPGVRSSRRNEVANLLRLRRRKGTAAVLEQLARDVTDWDASVVEYFQRIASTQYLNHLRPQHLSFISLRDPVVLESLSSPFDAMPRNCEVRRIASGRGRYNLESVGIFLWSLTAFRATRATAFRIDDRRYTFNALGHATPLCTRPKIEKTVSQLATALNVPLPIGRERFRSQLEDYYGLGRNQEARSILLRIDDADIICAHDANGSPIGRLQDLVQVCDLSDVHDATGSVVAWAHAPTDRIGIDPVLGRIALPTNQAIPKRVQVTYCRGFSMPMGGGEYSRAGSLDAGLEPVMRLHTGDSLHQALESLSGTGGVLELTDNDYYFFDKTSVEVFIADDKVIELRAADRKRPILVLGGDLSIVGGRNAAFRINGLLIAGGCVTAPRLDSHGNRNQLARLTVRHCTLLPGDVPEIGEVSAQAAGPRLLADVPALRLDITDSITSGIRFDNECKLELHNTIVDMLAPEGVAIAALDGSSAGGSLNARNTTIIGRVHVAQLPMATNTLFHARGDALWPAPVRVAQLSQGCVRFSFVPSGSIAPKPYRCHPTAPEHTGRVQPMFTSLIYGDAGYCQVSSRTAQELREGADDGAEMGAFHDLYVPQRLASLNSWLDEFLCFGLEAGVIRNN